MGEGDETIEGRNIGAMWDLEQKLDQPMDEEAHKLKNMYKEKVNTIHNLSLFFESYSCLFAGHKHEY